MAKMTYNDTTLNTRSVVNEFDLLSPKDVPFLKFISGGADDKPSLNSLSEPCRNTKFEWLEDADPPWSTTLLAALEDTTGTAVTVAVADMPYIVDGDIFLIDSEQMWVSASDGANTITVTRGWGSTTKATHLINTPIYIIGRAHKEGTAAPGDSYTYPTAPFNYCQELAATINLSELEQVEQRYGINNAVEYETAKKSRRLFIHLERQCFYGKRVIGTSAVPATFGGLESFIASSHITDKSTGGFTAGDIEDLMQTCYTDVGMAGMPDTMICNAWQRRKISEAFSSIGVTVYRDAQVRRGGVIVDVVDTHFGPLDILLTNWCQPDYIYIVNKSKLGIGPKEGKGFERVMLAKTGTSDSWMISGAYTLQVRAAKYHALLKGLTTS